ncbi:MAG TPA: HAD-IA family hydrolase [Acetobacteraceae bacterium]|nr:HAD-IA family hydrolase [Acetobacteraceae bacterium]
MQSTGLVIFDCDGVLVDSEVLACRIDAACLAEFGIPVTAEQVMDRYVGVSLAGMLADLEARFGRRLPAELADTLRRRTLAAFDAELTAIAGVDAVLASLALPRCVASSSEPARIRHSLTLTGLLQHFEPHVFSATQVANGKPAPDLFLFAAAAMGAGPESCRVIEDSLAGVQAARAAGMTVLGFTGGGHCRPGHAERLRAAGADAVFADMRELPALLAA